ncbi:MAG: virulence RhuM family protein [Bacteroidales bacterium]|nr:virulence RhuM family protein [Bacteroidales bacterium]
MEIQTLQNDRGEIVLYCPNEEIRMDVRIANETVWLNLSQIAILFDRDRSVISRHIRNVFLEKEQDRNSTVAKIATVQIESGRSIVRQIEYYNLDIIISVGYRVKSVAGVRFRKWANEVLKNYLLNGFSINQRFYHLEMQVLQHQKDLERHEEKIELFLKTPLPSKDGIFFNGQIFDAYVFVSDVIKKANKRILLIDNYIDESVLSLFSKRKDNVYAAIYTQKISEQLRFDIQKYNNQYPPIDVKIFRQSHDRFLIIDDELYLVGASLKDLGKKWFGFSKMESFSADEIIARLES